MDHIYMHMHIMFFYFLTHENGSVILEENIFLVHDIMFRDDI